MIVNGKEYPLWSQFVERSDEYKGKILVDESAGMETVILNIELQPNGKDSAFFVINGEEFNCGFDVSVGGISSDKKGLISFSGYDNHCFYIK